MLAKACRRVLLSPWTFWVCLALIVLLAQSHIPPLGATFHCHDESIRHVYSGVDSFTVGMLLSFALAAPLAMFFVGESVLKVSPSPSSAGDVVSPWALYRMYLTGSALAMVSNEILKTVVSEPRPHFIDTCKPDWDSVDCTQNDGYVSFSDSLCTGSNEPQGVNKNPMMDAMRSFPSGHAHIAVFVATTACLYFGSLRESLANRRRRYLLSIIQAIFVFLALWASLSRITDRRHHWWDVAAGASIGAVQAYGFVAIGFSHFQESKREEKDR